MSLSRLLVLLSSMEGKERKNRWGGGEGVEKRRRGNHHAYPPVYELTKSVKTSVRESRGGRGENARQQEGEGEELHSLDRAYRGIALGSGNGRNSEGEELCNVCSEGGRGQLSVIVTLRAWRQVHVHVQTGRR